MSGIKNLPSSPSKMSAAANEKAKDGKRQRPNFTDNMYGTNNETNTSSTISVGPSTTPISSTTVSPSPNSPNQAFGGVQLSESALAQRRSAYLPKLRQLSSNVTNLSFEQGSYRNEMMGEINFVYADCDTFAIELAELYSYSEMHEWATNLDSFTSYMQSKNLSPVWMGLEKREKQTVMADLVQSLEQTSPTERLEAARILLYILQGAFADFEEPYSEVVADSMEEARSNIQSNNEEEFLENFCLLQSACNAYLAYEVGLFKALCEALLIEANEATDEHASYVERGQSSLSNTRSVSSTDGASGSGETRGGRRPVTINENEMLRTTLSCLYHIIESIRRPEVLAKCTHVSDFSSSHLEQLQQQFIKELREPIDCVDKPLLLFLLDLIPPFIRGACVKVPIKKVILLAWKTLLTTFGGIATLRDTKAQNRKDSGLPAVEDTISVAIKMKSTNFSNDGQFAESTGTKVQRRYRGGVARGAFNRQQALTTNQLPEDSSSPREDKLPDEEDIGGIPSVQQPSDNPMEIKTEEEKPENTDQPEIPQANESRNCDTPAPNNNGNGGQRTPNGGERTPTATSPLPNLLPWTSKVRQCEVEQFIQNERMKFCGYKLPRDGTSLLGLPAPVQKSVEALRRHVYVSLGENQIAEEKLLNKYPFSRKEIPYETPIENIYKKMIPNLPTDSICFLKVLLAAIPSTKIQTKSDSAHILADVLTNRCPNDTSDLLSTSLNLDVSVSSHNVLEDAIRLAIDINRHKEIIVKATTALIINLLKFFRLSHVYEFENLSQQLVLTNCLPLILKFLDQNMVKYFQSKNELAPLCFPKAVVHYARNKREWPILNADNVGADQSDNQSYFMWRNVFASVNLLRILNKLTKNKHSRTMMLVVFKSTPILKRCLKLRSGIFQFYTLKLLKMQARYLGRQWRRTNMDIISAIYMKLRHRLNDDWAFANETRCKSWDFQAEERQLKLAIERFNMRRYGHIYPDLTLQMDVKDSISGVAGANAGKLLGAGEEEPDENNIMEDETEEDEEDFDPTEYLPVDNNLCSVLGEQVEFTPHFKRNYEKWLNEVVFKYPVNWDNVIMPTEQLEILLKQDT